MSLRLPQIEQNWGNSDTASKDEDIEFKLSILVPSIDKWQAFENGGLV